MRQHYPVELIPDDNGFIAQVIDVPEALTQGATREDALTNAQDALIVALHGYQEARRDIPEPSPTIEGLVEADGFVDLPLLVVMKLSIYQAMRDQNITQAELGERMGREGREVRRILDLDKKTAVPTLEAALRALGLKPSIEFKAA